MKKLILFIFLFISITGFTQTATVKDIELNNKGNYTEYITQQNQSFKIGDTISIGQPARGKFFSFIYYSGLTGESLDVLTINHSGNRATIKKITIKGKALIIKTSKPFTGVANFGYNIHHIEEAIKLGELNN